MAKHKNVVSINWDEEEGGKFIKNPGEYIVKATAVEQDDDDEGKAFLKWTFEVAEGKQRGATISTRTYITPKALWKLRELLECMGIEVPQGSVQELDLDEVIEDSEKFVIEVEEGNERADGNGYYMQVSDFMALEDYNETSTTTKDEEDGEEDAEAEEEEPVSKGSKKSEKNSKKKGKSKEADEDELLDQMEEEIDELGLDIDLDDYDTFEEKKEAFEEAKAKVVKKSKKKKEVEEEEEEQHYTAEEIEALGTKQLKVIAAEIGLELDEEASTRSKRRSVIAGLRKAGLLDED